MYMQFGYNIYLLQHNATLTSVSSARKYCSFIISVYVLEPTSGVLPPINKDKFQREN